MRDICSVMSLMRFSCSSRKGSAIGSLLMCRSANVVPLPAWRSTRRRGIALYPDEDAIGWLTCRGRNRRGIQRHLAAVLVLSARRNFTIRLVIDDDPAPRFFECEVDN